MILGIELNQPYHGEVNMLERFVETFCKVDDFCEAFLPQWEAYLLSNGIALRGRSPAYALAKSL
jgi:hypothetical protein